MPSAAFASMTRDTSCSIEHVPLLPGISGVLSTGTISVPITFCNGSGLNSLERTLYHGEITEAPLPKLALFADIWK